MGPLAHSVHQDIETIGATKGLPTTSLSFHTFYMASKVVSKLEDVTLKLLARMEGNGPLGDTLAIMEEFSLLKIVFRILLKC